MGKLIIDDELLDYLDYLSKEKQGELLEQALYAVEEESGEGWQHIYIELVPERLLLPSLRRAGITQFQMTFGLRPFLTGCWELYVKEVLYLP